MELISNMLISEGASVREALSVIDDNAQGVGFVVDSEGILRGILTDGDIRRALLKGLGLETIVSEVMQREYTSYPIGTSREIIQQKLSAHIRQIPLIDEDGRPVDFASFYRLNRIPIMEPSLVGNELAYVSHCVQTNWISSQGKYVLEFEQRMADFHNMPYALAMSNGTTALHLGLLALGISPGDEVIVPDFTFAATINAVLHANAIPVIADVLPDTWAINPAEIERLITPRTKAIIPVHLYGYPCNMQALQDLADKHNLLIFEDNAEALGSTLNGQLTGTFGAASAFSFFGNKTVTTGEGGLLLFKEKAHYDMAATLRDHGMQKDRRYWHQYVGYNYRMTNLQAAIGVAQMERIEEILGRKKSIGALYNQLLSDVPGLSCPPSSPEVESTYWLYTVMLDEAYSQEQRDQLIKKLLAKGIETRPVFFPLHQMPPYKDYTTEAYPVTTALSARGFSLPSFVHLQDEQIHYIVNALKDLLHLDGLVNR